MIVADIRNNYNSREIKIIESTDDYIYYSEEKDEHDAFSLEFIEYSIKGNKERIISSYTLDNKTFIDHTFAWESFIFLIMENGENNIWLFKIDKITGNELLCVEINCYGQYSGCTVLNENNLIIYTSKEGNQQESLEDANINSIYSSYLYSIETSELYPIESPFYGITPQNLYLFKQQDTHMLLLMNLPSGKGKSNWGKSNDSSCLFLLSIEDFIENIKSKSNPLNRKSLFKLWKDNPFELAGEDSCNLYFILNTMLEKNKRIYSYNKQDQTIKNEITLKTLENDISSYYMSRYAFKINRVSFIPDGVTVKGIYRCSVDASYNSKYGKFIDCIENRFIICKNILNENTPNQTEYITIYDCILKTVECFEAKFLINNDTLLLY